MNYKKLLQEILPEERIKTNLLDLLSYASDASFYNMVPKAVVHPINEIEIQQLLAWVHQYKVPITFRAGGTSLSGQGVTEGILVDLSRAWRKIQVQENGKYISVEPGVIGGNANIQLKKYQRKIGPDPSSINAAMMGGILSNNASGMCCGVSQNSYHTLHTVRFVLPNGKIFDTSQPQDYTRFESECQEISKELTECRNEIVTNDVLLKKIRSKYQTKNTVGYGLNAFIDFEHPLDILTHLMIGAEGTLGFISQATLQTVPDYAHKATALLCFSTMEEGCKAILPLKDSGAEAIELMDRASIRSVEHSKGLPSYLAQLPETASAILVEYQSDTKETLLQKISQAENSIQSFALLQPLIFTHDQAEQALLWKIRKGMFPSVGAVRQQGTTVVLEDIAFPIEVLAPAVTDLQQLFVKHQYENGIIFGHAKDGNLHFVVTQSFNTSEDVNRYERFMKDVVELVVHQYQGTLKAEHGTGRNMAPFVETEWGGDAYRIMKRLKKAIDPENLVNPGVILNEDPQAHLQHLKKLPVVESEVDKCIECGFCERNCPSRDHTLTPRRRIVVRRALAQLKSEGKKKEYKEVLDEYQYQGLDTCAVDGLCATDCPVDINTGELVKRLRREQHGKFSNATATWMSKNFSFVEFSLKTGIRIGHGMNFLFGKKFMTKTTRLAHQWLPSIPIWHPGLYPARSITLEKNDSATILYFSTCITRCMGEKTEHNSIPNILDRLSKRCGIVLKSIQEPGYCCGQPFSSKGFNEAFIVAISKTIKYLHQQSDGGKIPILLDGSSCTYTLATCESKLPLEIIPLYRQLRFMDSVEFISDVVLPKIEIKEKKKNIVFHPVCSLTKMGIKDRLQQIGTACSDHFTIPTQAGCCGMAGDRGFYFPELTQKAIQEESKEIQHQIYDGYYTSGKTCEISLQYHTQHEYHSLFQLLDEVSQ